MCLLLSTTPSACLPRGDQADARVTPVLEAPAIQSVSLTCDVEAGRWRLDVETTSWSGGGGIAWTEDGEYIEVHNNLRSIRAAPNGQRDTLRADLDMIDDFRPGGSGGRTVFSCRAVPTSYVFVLDLDDQLTDCVILGPDPSLLRDAEDVPLCTTIWEEASDI